MNNDYFCVGRMLKPNLAIFDLDGCIFDDEWRLVKILEEGEPGRYVEYHSLLGMDKVLPKGAQVLNESINAHQGIVFITARPSDVRLETIETIRKHFGHIGQFCLFMRQPEDEGIGSVELKKTILSKIKFSDDQKIVAAYDDRPDVIQMYQLLGIHGAFILDKNGKH
jgi:hypothetical protein